jgi:hypothetical protein
MVKNVSVSMAEMRRCQKHLFQHGWNVFWSKMSVSAWLECVIVKDVSVSMAGMCLKDVSVSMGP